MLNKSFLVTCCSLAGVCGFVLRREMWLLMTRIGVSDAAKHRIPGSRGVALDVQEEMTSDRLRLHRSYPTRIARKPDLSQRTNSLDCRLLPCTALVVAEHDKNTRRRHTTLSTEWTMLPVVQVAHEFVPWRCGGAERDG